MAGKEGGIVCGVDEVMHLKLSSSSHVFAKCHCFLYYLGKVHYVCVLCIVCVCVCVCACVCVCVQVV